MSSIYDFTDTWNNVATTFYGIKLDVTNTASAAASKLMDLQIGGASKLSVDKNGTLLTAMTTYDVVSIGSASNNGVSFYDDGSWFKCGGSWGAYINSTRLAVGTTSIITWENIGVANGDVQLARSSARVVTVGTSAGDGACLRTEPFTVATLPAAAAGLKGARAFVTDASATTFASTVAGGGANNVPVYCDGTNWRIG